MIQPLRAQRNQEKCANMYGSITGLLGGSNGQVVKGWIPSGLRSPIRGRLMVGGTLRAIVRDEVPVADRGAAQGLVNIGISVGSLLVVATLGALADMLGGGVAGLSQAYLACAGVMGGMALLVLGLRGK